MKEKISITIDKKILDYVDSLINNKDIRNRSQVIERLLRASIEKKRKALILAGGDIKKLRYKNTFKPLVIINEEELIKHTVRLLARYDVCEIIISGCINDKLLPILGDGSELSTKITYVDDNEAGTAGAVKMSERVMNSDFFVVSGDIFFDFDLNKMMAFHHASNGIVTIAVTTTGINKSKDQIELEGNRVVKFDYESKEKTFAINAGVYIMKPEIFEFLPKRGSLEKDVFPKLAKLGKITAYNFSGKWRHFQY